MTLVGIDFSIASPAVTIEKDGELFYYAIQRKDSKVVRKLNMLNNVTIEICSNEGLTPFQYYDKMTDMLIRWINSNIGPNTLIALEDWIYSLRGSALIDIVYATSILRYKLIKKYGEDKLNFYAPTHVKKSFTGNGRASKTDMLNTYNRLKKTSPFAQWCHKLSSEHKPEEDIIDSFAVMQTMKKEIEDDKLS